MVLWKWNKRGVWIWDNHSSLSHWRTHSWSWQRTQSQGSSGDGEAEGVQGQIEGMQGKIDKMQTEMSDKFAQQQKWQAEMTQNMKSIMAKLNKD